MVANRTTVLEKEVYPYWMSTDQSTLPVDEDLLDTKEGKIRVLELAMEEPSLLTSLKRLAQAVEVDQPINGNWPEEPTIGEMIEAILSNRYFLAQDSPIVPVPLQPEWPDRAIEIFMDENFMANTFLHSCGTCVQMSIFFGAVWTMGEKAAVLEFHPFLERETFVDFSKEDSQTDSGSRAFHSNNRDKFSADDHICLTENELLELVPKELNQILLINIVQQFPKEGRLPHWWAFPGTFFASLKELPELLCTVPIKEIMKRRRDRENNDEIKWALLLGDASSVGITESPAFIVPFNALVAAIVKSAYVRVECYSPVLAKKLDFMNAQIPRTNSSLITYDLSK